MGKKKIKSPFRDFESRYQNDDHYRIAKSMYTSEAWADLTLQQRGLYCEFKREYSPHRERGGVITEANNKNIIMPWRKFYKNWHSWQSDRDALIEHGFIKLEEPGKNSRTPNVYSLSANWQNWEKGAKK